MKKLIITILIILLFVACDYENDGKSDPIINPGDIPENPIVQIENKQLTTSAWVALLTEIGTNGKYVALDLSACTRGDQTTGGGLRNDGAFYPDPFLNDANGGIGKRKIVSLILPEAAISIPEPRIIYEGLAGPSYESMFSGFSVLKEVTGINITNIPRYSFANLGTILTWSRGILTSINFPNVLTIGEQAFNSCYNITEANIPKVQIIERNAFSSCDLQNLYIPDIALLGTYVFSGGNKKLTEFVFGKTAPKIDGVPFGTNVTRNVTVKVPQGAAGYGEIPNLVIGGEVSLNWANAFRGMGWNPDKANKLMMENVKYDKNGFGPIDYIQTGITLRIEYLP